MSSGAASANRSMTPTSDTMPIQRPCLERAMQTVLPLRPSMRRRLASLFATLLLVSSVSAAAQQPTASPNPRRAFTLADVRLREAPSTDARVIVILPKTTLVAVGDCDDSWCGVEFRGIEGFAARRYLVFSHPVDVDDTAAKQQSAPSQTGQGYINSRGQWVPSPQRTPD